MANRMLLRIAGREYRVEVHDGHVLVDGADAAPPRHAVAVAHGERRWVFLDGEVYEVEVLKEGRPRPSSHPGSLISPMPATVRKIAVEPGAQVKKGDTLLILEAMKMELPVRAPSDGTVTSIACREGELVQAGVVLVELE